MMDKEKKVEKQRMAKEALKAMQEIEDSTRLENIIKDNKIEFKSGDKVYRVRKSTLIEQQEIDTARRKKYVEYMNDDSYLFRKQWIEKYLKKGIDIKKMEDDIKRIEDEVKQLLLRLAQTSITKEIGELKDQILKLRDEQFSKSIEKTDLLSYCIEEQLNIVANSYTAYLTLERKEQDKWVKHFKDYDEFQNCDNMELINKVFYFMNHLLYSN